MTFDKFALSPLSKTGMITSSYVAITMAMCIIMLMCMRAPSWVEAKRISRK